MTTTENYERYFLKSLIEDLEATTLPELELNKELANSYDIDLCIEIESPKTSTSSHQEALIHSKNKKGESIPKIPFIGTITKEDIMFAISNQKSTLSLQSTIREMSSEEIEPVIEEMKGSFAKVMINKNGNYLCSDILRVSNSIQRLNVLTEVSIHSLTSFRL